MTHLQIKSLCICNRGEQIPGSHLQIIVTGIVRECSLHSGGEVLCTGATCDKFLGFLHIKVEDILQDLFPLPQ